MTDTELVRQAMALPGASGLQRDGAVWVDSAGVRVVMVPAKSGGLALVVHAFDARDGYAPGQHERGMDWTDISPDPHDDANGGLALGLLGDEAWRVRKARRGGSWLYSISQTVGLMGDQRDVWRCAASPFLAACRVAVSLGRWPGGVR